MPYPIPPAPDLTREQATFFAEQSSHFEGHAGDPEGNTSCAVYKDGRKSRWFSHTWDKLSWSDLRPSPFIPDDPAW